MRDTHTRLFVHCIWGTWNREALITPEVEAAVYADIRVECHKVKSELLEIGGTDDHVHALVQFAPTVCIADLCKQMKGASSHMTTHKVTGPGAFKWQGAYAAFTVSEYEVAKVRSYIRNQKEHHGRCTTIKCYELEVDNEHE
jgi:putative transposase